MKKQLTEEEKKERQRQYYLKNKEKLKEWRRQYRIKNKERISAKQKEYRSSKGHKPTVYLLPKENYVGTTENIHYRMSVHKYSGNNIDGYRILSEFDSREDALEVEGLLHDLGYNGRHKKNSYR